MESVAPPTEMQPLEEARPVEEVPQWQLPNLERRDSKDMLDNIGTCKNPTTTKKVRKVKRKPESLLGTLRATIVQHQLGLSINCLLLLCFTHALFPRLRPITTQFFSFSYYDAETGLYNPGWDDLKLVGFWIVVFTGLRAGVMDYILVPYARWVGIGKKKATIRFAEQAWMLLYYAVFWSVGMYLMYNSAYFFDLPAMWHNFPTPAMTGLFKWYYLAQFAFWLQQIVVVNIEERRKDHWQMFTHHIITSLLIFGSYGNYQTKVGNVILCLMDVVDLVLPVAKMLRYAGYQTACDVAFGIFIFTWFVTRHVFYLAVCWSLYVDLPSTYGCYNAGTGARIDCENTSILSNLIHTYSSDPSAPVCFNEPLRNTFLSLLLSLQVLTILWFGMICRVAYGVLSGKGAEDSRSDDEGEDEGEEDEEEADIDSDPREQIRDFSQKETEMRFQSPLPPREEEVGVEELRFVKRNSSVKQKQQPTAAATARRSKSRTSGISIPGHGDHKELLGRIGCDKPS